MDGKALFCLIFVSVWLQQFEKEGLSRRAAASRFGVGSHGDHLGSALPADRECGSRADGRAQAEGNQGEHHAWLVDRIRQKAFTLRGLVAELAERGLKVDYHSVWELRPCEKLSFKKNRARQRTGSPRRRTQARAVDGLSEPH